jgi:hypothetical protein
VPSVAVVLVLAALASAMAVSTAVFVRWAAGSRTALRASIVVFLLLMMVGMLAGALVYELWPSRQSAVAGLWLASVVMSASVVVVFVAFVQEARRLATGEPPSPSRWLRALAPAVVVLVLASETLMGWTFGVAAGSVPRFADGTVAGEIAQFGRIVVSPWFTFPMVIEMALSLAWLRRGLEGPLVRLLALQPIVMLCSPPSLPGLGWVVGTGVGSSAAMAAALAYLLFLAHRGVALSRRLRTYVGGLLLAFVLMGVGLAVWALGGGLAVFSAAVVAQMTVYLAAVLTAGPFPSAVAGREVAAAASADGPRPTET